VIAKQSIIAFIDAVQRTGQLPTGILMNMQPEVHLTQGFRAMACNRDWCGLPVD
jgi:hypothetical protein